MDDFCSKQMTLRPYKMRDQNALTKPVRESITAVRDFIVMTARAIKEGWGTVGLPELKYLLEMGDHIEILYESGFISTAQALRLDKMRDSLEEGHGDNYQDDLTSIIVDLELGSNDKALDSYFRGNRVRISDFPPKIAKKDSTPKVVKKKTRISCEAPIEYSASNYDTSWDPRVASTPAMIRPEPARQPTRPSYLSGDTAYEKNKLLKNYFVRDDGRVSRSIPYYKMTSTDVDEVERVENHNYEQRKTCLVTYETVNTTQALVHDR